MRTFSFGGGVQSTAVLVLQAQNKLPEPYDVFLFANVGDDSEHPDTIEYFHNVHKPFAEKNGIHLEEIKRVKRDGTSPTILEALEEKLEKAENKDKDNLWLGIPVYIGDGAPGRRTCTTDWKITVVRRWQRKNGSSRENPFITALGISMDEIQRARTSSRHDDQIMEYPLLDMGLNRADCYKIIKDAGLPEVPRSACWFCPFHSIQAWRDLKKDHPPLFQKTVELENRINTVRRKNAAEIEGGSGAYFTRIGAKNEMPLNECIDDQLQLDLAGPESCDSGSCFT